MKIIYTNKGEEILVDDEFYEELNRYTWTINNSGYAWRTARSKEKTSLGRIHVLMHRQIMGVADKELLVDHKDENKLNNQKSNLRIANKSTNGMNRGVQRNSTTGYKGVSYRKNRGKYQAYIWKDGKRHMLGCYLTAREAAIAYNRKAIELHGEFARLNEINE